MFINFESNFFLDFFRINSILLLGYDYELYDKLMNGEILPVSWRPWIDLSI